MATGSSQLALPSVLQSRTFKTGDLITTALPYAHIVSMKVNGEYCDWCTMPPKSDQRLLKCTACSYENYCDKSCQKKAWKYHKFECPLLKAKSPKIPSDSARLFTKLVYNFAKQIQPEEDPGWRPFEDVCHHEKSVTGDPVRSKQFMELCFTLKSYIGQKHESWLPDSSQLLRIFGRMVFNGFTLTHMSTEIGAALYISPSVFNHSCTPNAVFVTNGRRLNVRAVTDINTSTDLILVNYTEPMYPRTLRRAELLHNYYFTCQCEKCTDDKLNAMFEATLCPSCSGDAIWDTNDDVACTNCEKKITDDVYKLKCKQAAEKALKLCTEALKQDNFTEIKQFVRKNDVLSQSNVFLAMLTANLYAFESQFGKNEVAYELGQRLEAMFAKHYPKYFPAIGQHHFKQARLAWHMDDFDSAVRHYELAAKNFLVTHGRDHHIIPMLKDEYAECKGDQMMTARFGKFDPNWTEAELNEMRRQVVMGNPQYKL